MSSTCPTFFMVGAAKSGTTSLYRYLDQHPEVCMSSLKEPHWFSRVYAPGRVSYVTSEEEYLALFEECKGEPAAGEASPSYLWDEKAPWRIKEAVPHAKIIIILRHPVDRAYSDYLQAVQWEHEDLPLLEALKRGYQEEPKVFGVSRLYVDLGLYTEQVRRYFEAFGRERVRIFLYEDLETDPRGMLESVLEFLEVNPRPAPPIRTDVQYNKYSVPKKGAAYRLAEKVLKSRTFAAPWFRKLRAKLIPDPKLRFRIRQSLRFQEGRKPRIDAASEEFLMEIYRPEIQRLQGLIGRDLGHWLRRREER